MNPTIFVLIPGACHSSLCWQRIVPLLEKHGHCVITPDLLGTGNDHTSLSQIELSSWVNQIVNLIEKQSKPVVLVGHSRGGLIISEVAQHVPEKIKLLVYLSAYLVPSGETLIDNVTQVEGRDPDLMIHHADGTSIFASDKIIPNLYNTTPSEWADRVPSLLSPEPTKVFRTPLKLTDDRYGRVTRAYIECIQDKAVILTDQRLMQRKLPCKYVMTIDSDHSPFFSAPSELAVSLLDLATKE